MPALATHTNQAASRSLGVSARKTTPAAPSHPNWVRFVIYSATRRLGPPGTSPASSAAFLTRYETNVYARFIPLSGGFMKAMGLIGLRTVIAAALFLGAQSTSFAGDWPDWRGPNRDGTSNEKGLPDKWSLQGDNLAWKALYGGRSTPVILGDRLYLENTSGARETEQERLMCFNVDTGRLLWEYKFNVFQSDVPAHRVGWASPVADPETGNVYSFGVNDLLTALTRDGKKIWERSITEEFSPFTTHGGRTVSPMIDGNLVIVSTP